MLVDPDAVAELELRERLGRADRLKEIEAGADRFGERGGVCASSAPAAI